MMCEHPDMASRLRSEILERVGNSRTPTNEDIREMKYLRAFINGTIHFVKCILVNVLIVSPLPETLRLYPPVYALYESLLKSNLLMLKCLA